MFLGDVPFGGVVFFSWKATLKGNECIVLEDYLILHQLLLENPQQKKEHANLSNLGFVFHSKS